MNLKTPPPQGVSAEDWEALILDLEDYRHRDVENVYTEANEMAQAIAEKCVRLLLSAECGAVFIDPNGRRPSPPPCTKPPGHENGPETDWKRGYHSNGSFKWPIETEEI